MGPGYIDGASAARPADGGAASVWTDVDVRGVTTDSRRVVPGGLFIPLSGDNFDGHDYVESAFQGGAAAALWAEGRDLPAALSGKPLVLVDDPLSALQRLASAYRDQLKAVIIGITGSNGKTTTKDMTAAALGTVLRVHKTAGNLNNHIGLPLTVLALEEETEAAVLEMGMSGLGEISLLARIAVLIWRLLPISEMPICSSSAPARRSLRPRWRSLRASAPAACCSSAPMSRSSRSVCESPSFRRGRSFKPLERHRGRIGEPPTSGSAPSPVPLPRKAALLRRSPGAAAPAAMGWEPTAVEIPVPGGHNVSKMRWPRSRRPSACGIPAAAIAAGLKDMQLTGMRIQPVRAANGAMILNDAYNANPTAVRAAIDLVAGLSGYRRKWIVLSDMRELGPAEEKLHQETGAYITPAKADAVLTCGDC